MKKGGIAHGGHHVGRLFLALERLEEPFPLADGGAHAEHRVHRAQVEAQGVAADVAGVDGPGRGLFDGEKAGPVRTSGTKRRPTARRGEQIGGGDFDPGELGEDRGHRLREQLAGGWDRSVGSPPDPIPVGDLHFDHRHGLLDHQDRIEGLPNVADEIGMERKRLTDLKKGEGFPPAQVVENFLGMGGHHAGGQHGLLAGRAGIPENRRGRLVAGDVLQLGFQGAMKLQTKFGGRGPAGRVALKLGMDRGGRDGRGVHVLAAVADSRGRAKKDRHFEPFGQFKGHPGHLPGLPGRGGIEHRNPGQQGHHPAVLLRLGGMGTGIVGGNHHEAAPGAHVGGAHQRVGGHVEPHLLHAHRRPQAGNGRGVGDFEGDLFVHRPLDVGRKAESVPEIGHRRQNLGRRGSGIGRRHRAAAFQQPAGEGFVAEHHLAWFHNTSNKGRNNGEVRFQIAPPYWNPAEFVKRLKRPGRLFEGVSRPDSKPLEQKDHGAESGEGGLNQVEPDKCGQPKPKRGMNDGKQQGGQNDDPGEKQDGAIKIHNSSPVKIG